MESVGFFILILISYALAIMSGGLLHSLKYKKSSFKYMNNALDSMTYHIISFVVTLNILAIYMESLVIDQTINDVSAFFVAARIIVRMILERSMLIITFSTLLIVDILSYIEIFSVRKVSQIFLYLIVVIGIALFGQKRWSMHKHR